MLGRFIQAVVAAACILSLSAPSAGAIETPGGSGAVKASADTGPIEPARGTILFIGDSYVSMGNDVAGHRNRGWWSRVAARLDLRPIRAAFYGSGFLARARHCRAPNFSERLQRVRRVNPDILVVAGGRNDFRRCVDGKLTHAKPAQTNRAIRMYFRQLRRQWLDMGRSPRDVYVISPWGSSRAAEAARIRPAVRTWARHFGFRWVRVDRLPARFTRDGVHPTAQGQLRFARQFLENSQLRQRLARR